MSKSLETFFSRRKDSRKLWRKGLYSLKYHPSELYRSHRERDTSNWKSEENYSQPETTMYQKFETKERKKENFGFRHHIGASVKNCFFLCFGPTASKSICICNSVHFFICVKSNCDFSSAMLGEFVQCQWKRMCSIHFLLNLFFSYGWNVFLYLWNIVVFVY